MSLRVKRATKILLTLNALSLSIFIATADAEVSLDVQVGFHDVFRLGQPFPLKVELTNIGRPVEGTLEVEVPKGGPSKGVAAYSVFHRQKSFLGAQSQKSFAFTVDPDSVARPLTLRFSRRDQVLSIREVDLRGHFSPSPLILLLTENSVSPAIPLLDETHAPVISLSLNELPTNARAYQGVWAVLFYEQSLRDLSGAQRAALESWLSSGGRILFLGGLHYALYQGSAVDRLLPVRVVGLKRLASFPNMVNFYKGKGSPLRDILVQESRLLGGRILIEEKGTPIIAELFKGRGKVTYLALDVGRPPFSRWEGLPYVLTDLLGHPPGDGIADLGSAWNDAVFSRLLLNRSFLGAHSPYATFLLCLAVYGGGIFFGIRLWERKKYSRPVLAAFFFLFILTITSVGYLYFDRGVHVPDGVLISSTLMEGGPAGFVEVHSNLGIFSTRRRDYSLQVRKGWRELEMISPGSSGKAPTQVVIKDGIRSTSIHLPLMEWDYRLFRFRSMGSFPVRTEVGITKAAISLKVNNLSRRELTECWLAIAGQGLFLGEVAPGSSLLREIALSPEGQFADGGHERPGLWQIPFKDGVREALLRYSIFPQDQGLGPGEPGSAYLMCWVEKDQPRVWMRDPRVMVRNYTLFRSAFAIREDEES